MFEAAIFITSFALTFAGVGLFRRWSLKKRLLDVPNERSSHTMPTPRGGGIVIVFVCLSFYVLLSFYLQSDFRYSYLIGALLVAFVSWLDDLRGVSFIWRFLVHSAAATLLLLELGFWDEINLLFVEITDLKTAGAVITFLWIVWLTNAYNFMDGIDGIAGLQTVTAGVGWFLILKLYSLESTPLYAGVSAFAAIGFLIHNWQPAKIFMGDVGSAFLGYTFAALPLLARKESAENNNLLPLFAVVMVWFFLFDTILTFCLRLFKGRKVWTAHREHLYQKMIIAGSSHARAALLYGVLSALLTLASVIWFGFFRSGIFMFAVFWLCLTVFLFLYAKKSKFID